MPNYDFYCKKCERTMELNMRVRDRNETQRCICGSVAQRQIGLSNFHLKGSCWAKDGYRSKTRNERGKR